MLSEEILRTAAAAAAKCASANLTTYFADDEPASDSTNIEGTGPRIIMVGPRLSLVTRAL